MTRPSSKKLTGYDEEDRIVTPAKMAATAPSVCPICSTELKYLAKDLPFAHHTKSHVDPDPIVLPNGRVYGRERLLQLGAKVNVPFGKVRDPVTGETFDESEVDKVYIS
jgi:macrophage erythroblast attacher